MSNDISQMGFDLSDNIFSLIELDSNGRVSARNLYEFLQMRKADISRWLKSKIINNQFAIENEDYWGLRKVAEGNEIEDFDLTPAFAKKLCMMSKTSRGEEARNYFLKCEKKALELKEELSKVKEKSSTTDIIQTYLALNENERAIAFFEQRQKNDELERNREILKLENQQSARNIEILSEDLQSVRLTKAKDFKTVNTQIKTDIGKSINRLIAKHFKTDYNHFGEANQASWLAYFTTTGQNYPGAKNASYEEKLAFFKWLNSI